MPKNDRRISLNGIKYNAGNTESLRSSNSKSKAANIEFISRKSNKDEMDGYLIDYMAFNYLGKVIDNPELWTKFVHKKQTV